MKRILIALLLIFSLVICLPACDLLGQDKPIEENPDFAKFNEMFNATFENYTITVSTTSANGHNVNSKYVVTTVNGERSVAYTIETINSFVVDGDAITMPDGYKTTSTGVYDSVTSADVKFNVPHFNFSYGCIKNDIITHLTFNADILSLNDFMGLNVNASGAEFSLEYSKDTLKSMEITYVSNDDNTVVITYTFN